MAMIHMRNQKGFTLIELLIVISIIGIITGIVVFNQSGFADQISLSNTASEIDTIVREAQVYGVGVREFAPNTSEFALAYGASFNLGLQGSSNTSFIQFADRGTRNGAYDTPAACQPGTTSECLGRYNLTRGNTITRLCVIQAAGNEQCSPQVSRIDVTYVRPNPDARLVFYNSGGSQVTFPNHRGARVELTSPQGRVVNLYIYRTGQIAIQ
jgi:prepilin-type N-terminal cleavage/methylation domain-containing protein